MLDLISEAHQSGARISEACKIIGISEQTYFRWIAQERNGCCKDLRPIANKTAPSNKYSDERVKEILDTLNSKEFADLTPYEILPILIDSGRYLASVSTMYRLLRDNDQSKHRGRSKNPQKREVASHKATGPNQVWCWDITYLNGPYKGSFFYFYMILDIFSRKIVAWEVWEVESGEYASILVTRAVISEGHLSTDPLVLHSDNGSPMKAATMLATLQNLGIRPTNSRPRVSNDNAYAERIFGTLKYRPNYQPKGFETIEEAREWCNNFVHWYNYEHHHAGINFYTPIQMHTGEASVIYLRRVAVYTKAREENPGSWHGRPIHDWAPPTVAYLNPQNVIESAVESAAKTAVENGSETATQTAVENGNETAT